MAEIGISPEPGHPEILVASEAAEYLRIPKSTLYKLAQEGKIPACRVGKHWRFLKSQIHAWLAASGNGQGRQENGEQD